MQVMTDPLVSHSVWVSAWPPYTLNSRVWRPQCCLTPGAVLAVRRCGECPCPWALMTGRYWSRDPRLWAANMANVLWTEGEK